MYWGTSSYGGYSATSTRSKRLATTVADDDVLLMPEGMTREQRDGARSEVAELAMEYGYRSTARLHVDLVRTDKVDPS